MQESLAWLTHSRESRNPIWKNLPQLRVQSGQWPFQLSDDHTAVGLRERLHIVGET